MNLFEHNQILMVYSSAKIRLHHLHNRREHKDEEDYQEL